MEKEHTVCYFSSMLGFTGTALDAGYQNRKVGYLSSLVLLHSVAGGTFPATVLDQTVPMMLGLKL